MIPRRVMLFSMLLLVLVVSASSAWAQFTSGIEGTVTDPTGAVLSGATVTIKRTPVHRRHSRPATQGRSASPLCLRRPSL